MRWEGGGGGVSEVVVVVVVEAEGLGCGLDGLVHSIGLHLRVRVHHETHVCKYQISYLIKRVLLYMYIIHTRCTVTAVCAVITCNMTSHDLYTCHSQQCTGY